MANQLNFDFDAFIASQPQSHMDSFEIPDMNLDMDNRADNSHFENQANFEQAGPIGFPGANPDASVSSYLKQNLNQMRQDKEGSTDIDIQPPIDVLNLSVLNEQPGYDIPGPVAIGSERERLLNALSKWEREVENNLNMVQSFSNGIIAELNREADLDIEMSNSAPVVAGSHPELVANGWSDIKINQAPDDELYPFHDHQYHNMGVNHLEVMDEESWDRVLKGIAEDAVAREPQLEGDSELGLDELDQNENSQKRFKCSYSQCTKTYAHVRSLKIHVRKYHLKERNYTCETCGAEFFQKHEFIGHMKRKNPCTQK